MNITYKKPSDKVSEYVQDILVIENYNVKIPFCLPLFANGTPTLLFHTARGEFKKSPSGYLTLFGQTIIPDKLEIKDNFTLIAYFLKPYSLMSLFGIPAQELTDKPVDFNLVSKRAGLQEQLLNSVTVSQMIVVLDNYLCSLAPKNSRDKLLIAYAAEKIFTNPTTHILSEIQKDMCVTERTLQRMFEKNIGVSPNQFRKIHQFSRAFHQLNNTQFQNLSGIAYDNGYADQSHYIRVFKEFTNITPKEYLHLRITG
jgi:AraC-like DNA-binding protein